MASPRECLRLPQRLERWREAEKYPHVGVERGARQAEQLLQEILEAAPPHLEELGARVVVEQLALLRRQACAAG